MDQLMQPFEQHKVMHNGLILAEVDFLTLKSSKVKIISHFFYINYPF